MLFLRWQIGGGAIQTLEAAGVQILAKPASAHRKLIMFIHPQDAFGRVFELEEEIP